MGVHRKDFLILYKHVFIYVIVKIEKLLKILVYVEIFSYVAVTIFEKLKLYLSIQV